MSAGKSLDLAEMECDSCCFRETLDQVPNQMLRIQSVSRAAVREKSARTGKFAEVQQSVL